MLSKEELLNRVLQEVRQQMQYTILSYPERDPSKDYKWGEPGYNGNCTGKIPLGFIDKLQAKALLSYMQAAELPVMYAGIMESLIAGLI